ncbi:MAG: MMPL family transporter [Caulobacteraceae bacterium]
MNLTDRPGRQSLVERWVLMCCARARLVVIAIGAVAIVALAYSVTHFSLTSDTQNLLSMKLPYRQRAAAFDAMFQSQGDQIVVVADGRTTELAESAAAGLAKRLAARPDLFREVQRPDSGFFVREGLLYLPTAQVRQQMTQLVAAQPFLGPLAEDPSLRGLMTSLSAAMRGVSAGQAKLGDLAKPIDALTATLDNVRANRPAYFSWSAILSGEPPGPATLRRLVLVTPVLDFSHLESGSKATDFIRRAAAAMKLDPAHGVNVRLTGPIPLQDEQFGSIAHGVALIAFMAFAAILFMLWMAVRSPKLIVPIILTMLVGLVVAGAVGLFIFHRFNVISVAFIPLFVGLGIDFGIQFTVRFRAEHRGDTSVSDGLGAAGAGMGRSLILAATAIAVGFLAFAPTAYLGVSQLGVIAGIGMFMAVALNLTFLPALILLMRPPATPSGGGLSLVALDHFILGHRRLILGLALAAAAGSAALLPLLHFDFNPFHLENTKSEAVSASIDLMRDPNLSPNSVDVVEPSLAAADALGLKVRKLPEVAATRTLTSFVPTDQGPKLAAIADASNILGISLDPITVQPPPSDADNIVAMLQTAADIEAATKGAKGSTANVARRLIGDLAWLAQAPPEARARADRALTPGLITVLAETREALQAQPVTFRSLPPKLVRDWVTPRGTARLSITPRGDSNNNAVLARFIKAVRTVAPDVTGEAVGIYEGGRTIAGAFLEAGALSFIAITVLLFIVFRQPRYVAITMAPIVLTGLLTLASCVVIGQPLNYANIIALPLLFGIGVAFHIYFVMAWRRGTGHLLQSSLTRAIFFSALATATGFGSLWASHHPGTASMGQLLMISLLWTLVSALLFQPALMGPPPDAAKTA